MRIGGYFREILQGSVILHLLCLLRGKALHQTEHIRERWICNDCIGFRSTAGLRRRFNVPFHRDSFVRFAAILFDWRYIEPRLVRRRCRPGRLVHPARDVFQQLGLIRHGVFPPNSSLSRGHAHGSPESVARSLRMTNGLVHRRDLASPHAASSGRDGDAGHRAACPWARRLSIKAWTTTVFSVAPSTTARTCLSPLLIDADRRHQDMVADMQTVDLDD